MSAIAAFFRIGYNMYNNKLGTIQVLHQQVFFNSGPPPPPPCISKISRGLDPPPPNLLM